MQLSTVTWLVRSSGEGESLPHPWPIFTPPAPMSWMYVRSTRQRRQLRWNQIAYGPTQEISQSWIFTSRAASAWMTAGIRTAACPSPWPSGGKR